MIVPMPLNEPEDLVLRRLHACEQRDVGALQAIFEAAPGYSLLVTGKPPTSSAGREVFDALPLGSSASDKFTFEVRSRSGAIGCLDIVRGYPQAHIAFIGLILLVEHAQGRAYGPKLLDRIDSLAASWACSTLRIAVIETNIRALSFWQREGFVELLRKESGTGVTGRAIVMERTRAVVDSTG